MSAQHDTYDLVIVGSGIAGWTTARRAQQLGARPVVLEKHTAGPGMGNSRISGGHYHAAYRDPRLPAEVLFEELTQKTKDYGRADLIRAWADNVGRGRDFLVAEGAEFAPLSDLEFQHNVLHPYEPSGMTRAWAGKGPDKLLTTMWQRYVAEGGTYRAGRRAVELVVDGGSVKGVIAEVSGGTETYEAKAVVLCDGGFQANPKLVERYITPVYKQRCSPSDRGDALEMGLAIGAKAVNMEWFYGHTLSRDALLNDALWPIFGLYGLIRAGFLVDGHGERFIDEGLGDEIVADRICKSTTPGGCWVVFDEEAWESTGRAGQLALNPNFEDLGGGTVLSAYSPEELATKAGMPAEAFASTFEAYNAFVEFGKEMAVARTHASKALARFPLHAIPAVAGITFTMGGLLVNANAQVLREDESVISGLYAAGGSMGGLQGGPGFGYSGGWSEATTFGLLAAEHASSLV